ncbi:MAG: hypothetical protein ABSD75_34150, partial [Terriglobales bacterium]
PIPGGSKSCALNSLDIALTLDDQVHVRAPKLRKNRITEKRQPVVALVSMTDSITNFPSPFITATAVASLWTSMPMYLMFMVGAPFGRILYST